ncbi:MAG: hypothetical protein K8F59_17210 [Rhodobacteraceae bacterium]|nr:hypothetical protein [Paracoccaceae bacterium]
MKYLRIAIMLLFWAIFATASLAEGEHLLVRQVLEKFVKETGLQIVGVGSWVTGENYKPGVSDHDLRLVLPEGTSPEKARQIWVEAREKLKTSMVDAFRNLPDKTFKTSDILAKTNFYPPDQMMGGVVDMNKAWETFKSVDAFPNLAAQPDKAKIEAAEGLYGAGAKSWRQSYELEKGIWLYPDQAGGVATGSAKTVHIAEGIERHSASGLANTGQQWIEHAWDELRHDKNGKTLGKYLERMTGDLEKSMNLSGMANKPGWFNEAAELGRHLQKHPEDFLKYESKLSALLQQGYKEAAIATQYAAAGPVKRAYLDAIQRSCAAGSAGCMIEDIMEFGKKFGQNLNMSHAMQLAMVAMDLATVGSTKTEAERAEAIYSAIGFSVNLPVGFGTILAEYGRDKAEAFGVSLVSQFQDVWDMMDGVYSSTGRSGTGEYSWPIDRLLRDVHTEEQLKAVVRKASFHASERGFGQERTGALDRRLADKLFDKAWPVVLAEWTRQRTMIANALDEAMFKLAAKPITLSYSPNPAYIDPIGGSGATGQKWAPLDVEVSYGDKDKRLEAALDSVRTLMGFIGETNAGVATASILWDGKASSSTMIPRKYTYAKPGDYPVNAVLRIMSTAITHSDDTLFDRSVDIPVSILVRVIPPEKNLTDTRTASFERIEPPVTNGRGCVDFSTSHMKFTFPVHGGEITDFDYFLEYRACADVQMDGGGGFGITIYGKYVGTNGKGTFDGKDGGKFRLTYSLASTLKTGFGDGPTTKTRTEALDVQIWASGKAEARDPEEPDDPITVLTFEPF